MIVNLKQKKQELVFLDLNKVFDSYFYLNCIVFKIWKYVFSEKIVEDLFLYIY